MIISSEKKKSDVVPCTTSDYWLPMKDSNPHKLIQSQVCYHYTNRQRLAVSPTRDSIAGLSAADKRVARKKEKKFFCLALSAYAIMNHNVS